MGDDPQCVLKVLCQEIINVQNAQIQTMRGVLASLDYKETDNCVVEIPVDPETACLAESDSTGYIWCPETRTCDAPHGDACEIAACPGPWCVILRTCDPPGSDACEKAECEKNTGSDGYKWCGLLQTCVAPSDTSCDQAECEKTSGSTGYVWCTSVQQCIPFAECDPT